MHAAPVTVSDFSGGSLAGYRVVRRLGSGSRADVFLGVAAGERIAALKVFSPQADRQSIDTELEALGRANLPHCVRMLDVSSGTGSTPVLVLERLRRGSLADLLRSREVIEPGELVTILAPIAATMDALHALGVAHGTLGVGSILFGEAGQPVLIGFGRAGLIRPAQPPAALDIDPVAAEDRRRLASLAGAVLARVNPDAGAPAEQIARWLRTCDPGAHAEFGAELVDRLFGFAAATPVALGRVDGVMSELPARVIAPGAAVVGIEDAAPATAARSGLAAAASGLVDDLMGQQPMTAVRRRAATSIRAVRTRLWVVLGAVAVALTAALLFVPQSPAPAARTAPAPPTRSVSTPAPVASGLPADPVLALPVLMETRTGCIRDLSILCLDAVDQQGASAMAGDTALIRRIQAGQETGAAAVQDGSNAKLVERLGDSALVSFGTKSKPASALLIRDEAGWRIRAFVGG
ncbi:MAG: hypothetical protein JWQ12_238 [Glaciihabitans sp.]|nr:hypothetical protein [Glaciihabitans sp.]